MIPLSMTLSDLWPHFKVTTFFEVEYRIFVLKTKLLLQNRKLYLAYGMIIRWPWLTSKRVAQVCQHQLSFLFDAPQGRLVAPIHVKLGMADGHVGPRGVPVYPHPRVYPNGPARTRIRGYGSGRVRRPRVRVYPVLEREPFYLCMFSKLLTTKQLQYGTWKLYSIGSL